MDVQNEPATESNAGEADVASEESATQATEQDGAESWWSRSCGGREVMQMALPLVISTGSWSMLLYFDRLFLYWHDANAIAAAMPAGAMYWCLICGPLGVVGFTNTLVAQYHGANQPARIGSATWQGMFLGFLSTPAYLLLIPLAPWMFSFGNHDPVVQEYEVIYFQTLMFGAGAGIISGAQGAFFTGRGKTVTVMLIDSGSVLLNIALDYVLIFGLLGFPELGIRGAALGTVIALWCKVVAYHLLMCRASVQAEFKLVETRKWDSWLMRRLIRFGFPSGLQLLIEASAFTFLVMLMGQLGKTQMTACTVAMSLNSVAFIPMIGISIAASTLVGQQLTRGRADLAARATWTSLVFGAGYSSVFILLYVGVPDLLLAGHAAGVPAEEFQEIRDLTVVMLRFVAAYCVIDAVQVVFVGALRGAGDTRFVMVVTAIASAICCLICYLGLGFGWMWWWVAVTSWISILGVVFTLRFVSGVWKNMRVIEEQYFAE